MRHTILRIGGQHPGDVDQVGDDRARGRLGAGTLAVIHRVPDRVALDQHRIHRPLDVGDQPARRYQRRMHTQLDAAQAAVVVAPPRDAEQLDPVAELLRVPDVLALQPGDALDMGLGELHRHPERDRRQDRRLVRGVDALDVERRIGLRVAQPLCLGEHGRERKPLVAHLAQDEVGGAVDDAGDPLDAVRGQSLANRLDDRDAAGDGGFERDHHAAARRGREDLVAVHGQQRLVGGDHVFAVFDRIEDQPPGDRGAADQLDDDVDRRIGDDVQGVADHRDAIAGDRAGALDVQVGDLDDLDAAAGATLDLGGIAPEDLEGAAADRADAEQPDSDRAEFFDGLLHSMGRLGPVNVVGALRAAACSRRAVADSDPGSGRGGRRPRSGRPDWAGRRGAGGPGAAS